MKQPRGQLVIDKILDTAETLFYRQGYNSTGINQVIDEAGIAKASLYQHFPSKADLLIAYIQRTHQRWYARLEADLEKTPDPKQKLLVFLDHHSGRQIVREFGGCPFIKANDEAGMSDPRVLAEIQNTKQHLKDLIATTVANAGHNKTLSDQELTDLIYLMVEGGSVAASIFKNTGSLHSAKQILQKLI